MGMTVRRCRVNVQHLDRTNMSDRTSMSTVRPGSLQPESVPSPQTVLEELFNLLEEYAPTWYKEEHHDRAVAALLGREF